MRHAPQAIVRSRANALLAGGEAATERERIDASRVVDPHDPRTDAGEQQPR